MTLMHECDNCTCPDERVFRDSFTGLSLCLMCLYPIIGQVTTSPGTEGDNLKKLLEMQGSTYEENDNYDVNAHVNAMTDCQPRLFNDPNR